MTRYLTRDRIAIVAALVAPLTVAAVLLPFRASWSNTNAALLLLLLVVVVVVNHVREQLTGLLDLRGARFEYGALLGHPPRLEPDGTVTVGHSRWDVELSGLPAQEIELRTFGNGQYYGRFMLQARPGSARSAS
ncbi:MAG: hypothetical protein ABSA53_39020 [Streptosporangiaceae bacterium]